MPTRGYPEGRSSRAGEPCDSVGHGHSGRGLRPEQNDDAAELERTTNRGDLLQAFYRPENGAMKIEHLLFDIHGCADPVKSLRPRCRE